MKFYWIMICDSNINHNEMLLRFVTTADVDFGVKFTRDNTYGHWMAAPKQTQLSLLHFGAHFVPAARVVASLWIRQGLGLRLGKAASLSHRPCL